MPQLDPIWYVSQLVWLALTFVFLFLMVGKYLLPRLNRVVEARDEVRSERLSLAEVFRKEAAGLEAQYERAMADGRERAKSAFSEAEQSIKALSDNANRQLDAKLAERFTASRKRVADQRAEMQQHFSQTGAALVADIAAKVTGNAPALVEAQKAFSEAQAKRS